MFFVALGIVPVYAQYILNTKTRKVHEPTCHTIRSGAYFVPVSSLEEYDICKVCKPKSAPASFASQVVPSGTGTSGENVNANSAPANVPAIGFPRGFHVYNEKGNVQNIPSLAIHWSFFEFTK